MIQFSRLGQMGRLGNSLFQIASTIGIAKSLGTEATFPLWKYSRYFKHKLNRMYKKQQPLFEPSFHYDNTWYQDGKDYIGWLQSDKYFESKEQVKQIFEFDATFKELVKAKFRKQLENKTICISIRRGDFVGNENYELIPIKYYIGALLKFDYKDYNVLIFSDDIAYCKRHFECIDAYFIDADPIEQLCLMTMCDNHIISNSTFSWWGAYLSNSERVICPAYNFSKSYLKKYSDKDYYCSDWEVFDHKNYFLPLDATFLIPVQYDHNDRLENYQLCIKYLKENFSCQILTGENNGTYFNTSVKFQLPKFHRTKMLNVLARTSNTDTIIIYDADVLTPPFQLYLACEAIRNGSDMVYPYDGRFARVPRKHYNELTTYLDVGVLKDNLEGTRAHDLKSVGGAIVFNKKSYFAGGGENERFISYAPEDVELFYRFKTLGYKVERIRGVLYHVDHFIGLNSHIHHEDYEANEKELEKIKQMTNEQIREYVVCSAV